jgi:hypothetical protein
MSKYSIAWEAGPSVQVELFSPAQGESASDYRLKFKLYQTSKAMTLNGLLIAA